jgi:hypothetical protein
VYAVGFQLKLKQKEREEIEGKRKPRAVAKPKAKPKPKPKPRRTGKTTVEDDDDSDGLVGSPTPAPVPEEGKRVLRRRQQVDKLESSESEEEPKTPPPPSVPRPASPPQRPAHDDSPDALPVSEAEHILPCTLKRADIVKYHDEPFFPEMSANCFVRVLAKSGVKRYMVAQVGLAEGGIPTWEIVGRLQSFICCLDGFRLIALPMPLNRTRWMGSPWTRCLFCASALLTKGSKQRPNRTRPLGRFPLIACRISP